MRTSLRRLPSVDSILRHPDVSQACALQGRALTVDTVREVLGQARQTIQAGEECPATEVLVALVLDRLERVTRPTLRPAINATGVIVHTNLGRAPLSQAARTAMLEAVRSYSNLEYDLALGHRGSRYAHAAELLCRLTGAQAALVVNNNAGAVLLALTALARGREVIISRGQLVEIGGGFRIPDVLAQSGARLVEVGSTNRTRVRDFEAAISRGTAMLLSAHRSNFRVDGFTEDVSMQELVDLGRDRDLPVVNDLGSGTLLDTTVLGMLAEPTVQHSVQIGVQLVTFSGDKLLGGPQAGIIVGKRAYVDALREHPLTRALRVDKTTLAGLQATLLHYLRGEALEKVPVWRMIAMQPAELRLQAEMMADELHAAGIPAAVRDGRSTVGGGSLPGQTLPTTLVALRPPSAEKLASRLRAGEPAVIARIEEGHLLLDPRTVQPDEHTTLLDSVRNCWERL